MKLLVLREPHEPLFYEIVEDRLKADARFEIESRSLNDPLPDYLNTFDLVVPWLQDPCDDRPDVYGRALGVQDLCDLVGVPMVNRPENLPNSRKTTFSAILRKPTGGHWGFDSPRPRVAQMWPLTNPEKFVRKPGGPFPLPLFIREDDAHASPLVRLDAWEPLSPDDAKTVLAMRKPVVVEFIETRGRDGTYRKYRYVVAGDRGVPQHTQTSESWITRGTTAKYGNPAYLEAERAFLADDASMYPELHDAAARLGFDFCAFDFARTEDGELAIWEVNPLPMLHYPEREYRRAATERVIDAMTDLYLESARCASSSRAR